MRQRLCVFAVSSALILRVPLFAQTSSTADLATGIGQVEEGELEVAVITLDAAVQRLSLEKGREKDLARAHLYLGVAHLGLGQSQRAKAEFRSAWRSDQQLTLDPKKFSPRVRQLYEAACEEARAAEPEASAPPQSGGAARPAPAADGTQQRAGGGHTGLVLLGVGGAVLAGGAVALAGKGKDTTTTAAGATTPGATPPAALSSAVTPISANRGVLGLEFVSAQPAPGSTVTGVANAALFAGSFKAIVSVANPTGTLAKDCSAWAQLQSEAAQCLRVASASTFNLAPGQSLQVVIGVPDMGTGVLASCPVPLRIRTMHVDVSCGSGPIFPEVPGAPGYTGRDWSINYQIDP